MIIWRMASIALLVSLSWSTSIAQPLTVLEQSRDATVRIFSDAGKSSGTGFLIDDEHVITNFHVAAAVSQENNVTKWVMHQDLKAILPSGESILGTVVSIPSPSELAPIQYDFAIIKLKSKPIKSARSIHFSADAKPSVGDEVVFSGYPLGVPGMVTHRGMVSGFTENAAVIFIQASINKGNSGGALLDAQGRAIGIVSAREGGISKGLAELAIYIEATSTRGSVQIMGVNPLQATQALIQTLDLYISTGIGYAISTKFVREYLERNPTILK